MSDDVSGPGRQLQEWADDFDALVYQPIRRESGRVLNAAHEPPTIYETDLEDLSCTCDHGEKGPTNARYCKHLAKAMLAHPDYQEGTELMTHELSLIVDRAAKAVRDLEKSRNVAQAKATADKVAEAADTSDDGDDGGDDGSDLNPVAIVEDWITDDLELPPSKFNVWHDDDLGSVQIETDGYLEDDEFGVWMEQTGGEPLQYDGDNDRNYLPVSDVVEELT
jgi:hypothetical protein